MVSTIKFSEFSNASVDDDAIYDVGLAGGINTKQRKFVEWTTATRPVTPYDGLLGYNTDLSLYEYWDNVSGAWSQLEATTGTFTWINVTSLTQDMEGDNGYVANNAGQVVFTLPATAAFGQRIRVAGYGSGGWQILFNAAQNVIVGNVVATTATGTISSVSQYDQIELLCVVANTTFLTLNMQGNLSIT